MSLDIGAMTQVFLAIGSGNNEQIKQAEFFLEQNRIHPDFFRSLLSLICCEGGNPSVQLQASIRLKNEVKDRWSLSLEAPIPQISPEDRNLLKENIVPAIIFCTGTKSVALLLKEVLFIIVPLDIQSEWPSLLEILVGKIKSASKFSEFFGVLGCIRTVFSKFEDDDVEERQMTQEKMIDQLLPILKSLAAMQMQKYEGESLAIVNLLLKILFSTLAFRVPLCMLDQIAHEEWMGFIKQIVDSNLGPRFLEMPKNDEERIQLDKSYEWRNKALAARIVQRFFQIHINPKKDEENPEITQIWVEKLALPFLSSFLQWIGFSAQNAFVSPKFILHCISSVYFALDQPVLQGILVPEMESLMFDGLLPQLYVSKIEDDLWNQDPEEYVRREEDRSSEMNMKRSASFELIEKICQLQSPSGHGLFIYSLMNFLALCFESNTNPRTNAPVDLRAKDGLLMVYGHLYNHVKSQAAIAGQTEQVLARYVIPQMVSAIGFLQARACWVFSIYGNFKFSNPSNLESALQGILACASSPCLPVSIKGALALETLLLHAECLEFLRPQIPNILDIFLRIASTMEHNSSLKALSNIVSQFGESITPFALQLVDHLTNVFFKYQKGAKEGLANTPSAEEALTTIRRIMQASLPKESYGSLFMRLVPVFDFCLSNQSQDLLEDALPCLSLIVYHSPSITEEMWFYYNAICYIVGGAANSGTSCGLEKLNNSKQMVIQSTMGGWKTEQTMAAVGSLQNFVAKGGEILFTASDFFGVPFISNLFRALNQVFKDGLQSETDPEMICGLRLLGILIENNSNSPLLDGVLASVLTEVAQLLGYSRTSDLKSAIYTVLALCLWARPVLTVSHLSEYILEIIQGIASATKSFESKRRALMGMGGVVNACSDHEAIWKSALKGAIYILDQLVRLREKEQKEEEENDGREGTMAQLMRYLQEEEEEDESYDQEEAIMEENEDLVLASPLDAADEILEFKNLLVEIEKTRPEYFGMLVGSISSEEQKSLVNCFSKAETP